jgi:hypothetical protein
MEAEMAGPPRNERLEAAESRAKDDAARTRGRAGRAPIHPSRNTRPRANPEIDHLAIAIGVEKLRSVIAK